MCKKKNKTRQSHAKICLIIMVKIKEWSSKLHVQQLPSKNPDKIFRSAVGLPPMVSEMPQLTLLQY